MLYLMMDKRNGEYLVKVGFSNRKIENRRSAYYSYNPLAIMRSTCAGSSAMEKECHYSLTKWGGIRIKGTEWFVVSESLFNKLYEKGMSAFRPRYQPIHFLEKF